MLSKFTERHRGYFPDICEFRVYHAAAVRHDAKQCPLKAKPMCDLPSQRIVKCSMCSFFILCIILRVLLCVSDGLLRLFLCVRVLLGLFLCVHLRVLVCGSLGLLRRFPSRMRSSLPSPLRFSPSSPPFPLRLSSSLRSALRSPRSLFSALSSVFSAVSCAFAYFSFFSSAFF